MASQHDNLEMSTGGLLCAAVSDVGMRRSSNQDSMAIALADGTDQWLSQGHLLVVADGMGAHAAGELASKLATDTITHSYHKRPEDSPSESLVEAIREANNVIYTKGQDSVDFQGMGTTCSSLLLLPKGALAAHVGDSRVYRLRGNSFDQLT
ncbi:MAG: protein phosphatase 2C domain-containing protein, partial [Pirellulales bacterium]|nr:protein phosphatase 2C domain-containing protein [Pirellulales bacterium]